MLGAMKMLPVFIISTSALAFSASSALPAEDGPQLLLPNVGSAADREDSLAKSGDSETEATASEQPQEDAKQAEEPAEKAAEEASEDSAETSPGKLPAKSAQKPTEEEAEERQVEVEPRQATPPSEKMLALRDQLRETLALFGRWSCNTRDNTAAEIICASLPLGCKSQVLRGGSSGEQVNAITCLCWNYPCGGFKLLKMSGSRIVARVGYGLQQYPGQFLATLAQSRVPIDYPIRVGEEVGSVADLVEEEKLTCRPGADMSLKLIGLSYYLPADERWKSSGGDDWSIERIVREELALAPRGGPCGGTNRLMGLSFAVDRRRQQELPVDGQFDRARQYVAAFQDHTLGLQNPDGSWHPSFFAYQGNGGSAFERLRSTGHILEWLAFSLDEERLQDPRVVKSVAYVASSAANRRRGWDVTSMATRDLAGLAHALHALAIYDRRVFAPWDPEEPEADSEQVAERP